MIFITFGRWRKKPTKEMVDQATKLVEQWVKGGGKIIGQYWTLGRHVAVCIAEGKDEKAFMKWALLWGDLMSTETLVALTREEAIKLVK
jgi:uncharacterized protein with GYD domain